MTIVFRGTFAQKFGASPLFLTGQFERHPALRKTFRPRDWLFAAALVVAVFRAYQPAWLGGFVWDDDLHLLDNPVLKPGGDGSTKRSTTTGWL